MKYIVLDDEIIAANYLAELIKENDEGAAVTVLNNPVKALEIAFKEKFDVCFIDIQMPGLNGIEFADKLKSVYPKTNFIFVTGYSEYMRNAFELDASGYIMKPANSKQVKHAIENLRYTKDIPKVKSHKIKVICFGNFDVLIDDEPVKFKFDKTKELMAFLVHKKGARCTNKEVMATLWEDEGHSSYYRMLKKDLQDTLGNLKCGEIIYSERGSIGLTHLECIDCDYFKWIENRKEGRKLYHGEYMAQYSWAEEINALIELEKYSLV
ncbi:MAG: response regulator [Hornefia sp.]|nr:response regulator [Hornefia sp.]